MDPSKEPSFNDQWKKAFDEASITPPASAWEGIEARLDHDAKNGTFEDQWGKAFSDAAVTPVPSVWEAIEARLDKEDDVKIIPIWWYSTKVWFAAASIAGLLIGGALWFKDGITGTDKVADTAGTSTLSLQSESASTDSSSGKLNNANEATVNEPSKNVKGESIASIKSGAEKFARPGTPDIESIGNNQNKTLVPSESLDRNRHLNKGKIEPLAMVDKNAQADRQIPSKEDFAASQMVHLSLESSSNVTVTNGEKTKELLLIKSGISAEMLRALPYRDLAVYFQTRYVFFKDQEQEPALPAKKHQEYWAGIGVMPGSFNPHVNLKTSPAAFASQSFANQKSLTGKNDAGFSYAVQTQGGMRISKHWSVESGITYLQGNSQYEGGGYLLNAATSGSSNVLENALADAFYSNKGITSTPSNNSIYIDVSKQVRNDYQYLQLPVQAGFTLNPEGKLSYSVLGGMMANFFLNNELQSDNGDVIKTTVSDDVYRGTNWAATTGLRFNYRVSSKWRAMLTGSYQKAVTSGFRANQNLESHPSMYGVAWGMRYSF